MTATATKTKNETILEVAELLARAACKEQLDDLKQTYGEEAVRVAWSGLSEIVKRRLVQICVPNAKPAPIETEIPPAPPAEMTTTPQEPTAPPAEPAAQETPAPKDAHRAPKRAKDKKPKLWELAAELNDLDDLLDDLDEQEGLTDQERKEKESEWLANYLELDDQFDQKAINVACYIKHLEAVSEAQKAESRRLWNNGAANENKADRLREYLAALLLKVGKKSVKGIKANLSIRKKPAKVVLTVEPEQLPEDFKKVEVTPKLAKIKEYLKEHPDCDFASFSLLEEFNVTIR